MCGTFTCSSPFSVNVLFNDFHKHHNPVRYCFLISLFLYTVLSVWMSFYLLLCVCRVLEQHLPHFQPVPLLLHAICLFLHRVGRICRCKKGIVNFSNSNVPQMYDILHRAEHFDIIYKRLVEKKLIQSFLKILFCENIILGYGNKVFTCC